ncbi:MAG: YihA family ribosome biogenesis GTP-binding protein [Vampirovibrionales bacterium]|nr:YihA family ribosome biogenesis GTP-binding protein [Vampirovibrionales bacterium]
MKIHVAEFIKSAPSLADAPVMGDAPEIAFVGRSNVGKSSLINCLTGRKNLAKTSNTPGKTRLINYYWIDNAWFLVDLPGYGYARVSKTEQARWQKSLETYLRQNPRLRLIFLLADGRHGFQPNDIQMAQWLRYHDLPTRVALTKADKAAQADLKTHQRAAAELLGLDPQAITLVASPKNQGREAILAQIEAALTP